jgi:hypothetical protein
MDTCLNVSCTNAIYKHIHCGEYTNMYIMLKRCQNIFVNKIQKGKKNYIFFTTCKFVMAFHDKNVICDSAIWGENYKYDEMTH